MKLTIERLHNCAAYYLRTDYIAEDCGGEIVWQGSVEVFVLVGHPKAERCYGWSYGEPEKFITILKLPPVTDAQSAVTAGAAQIKKTLKK